MDESWQSNKYDFSDPHVRLEYVPEMGCSVGGCISALKKLWKSYKIAGRNGEPRGDIAWKIRTLQGNLGLQKSEFPELEGMNDDNEDQSLTNEELEAQREEKYENGGGEWNLNSRASEENSGLTEEWSELDKRLLREELEAEEW